ncbi:MAG TPA: hypothetical protein PKE57_03605 [Cellvibrionaceae bacterium]|nr:hypothetical protein [Cellvibrionaceae bacterium]HMW48889.1 hypothetical protein [Cellvibrionaceae bacterium]HMW72161.1 hypothetical protein [Cellvibrionaceae bacterium]HMY39522.1 hypothetical protein [Marinagarivorans sp.]HNG58561.1 hypothetical protein [Cellvibrionaceae bacterium]
MERVTIADALRELEDLAGALDNAYWDTAQIQQKDVFYNLISMLHSELNELAKLSVSDHYMAYEPITAPWRNATGKLRHLHSNLDGWIIRTKTATVLEQQLPQVIRMLTPPL